MAATAEQNGKARVLIWMRVKFLQNFQLVRKIYFIHESQCIIATIFRSGGTGSYLSSCRFSEIDDRPSKEICQSFVNRNEHA